MEEGDAAPNEDNELFVDPNNKEPAPARRSTMAYKEMPYHIYFIATTTLYVFQMIGAILIIDIGLIFEFVSAIAMSILCFIGPGVLFIMAERKWAGAYQQ